MNVKCAKCGELFKKDKITELVNICNDCVIAGYDQDDILDSLKDILGIK